MRTPLSDIEIQRQLGALSGWMRRGRELVRTYEFSTFAQAIAFVDRIAPIADAQDHHPDIDIRYNTVVLHLSTHSAGGITGNDFKLAMAIDGS